MFQDEIVVGELLDIACYSSVNVVGFFVVLQVFVICEYCDREGGADVMSLQGHTARRERKVSVGSRESVVQWCDGSEEVSTTKYGQRMRGIQWIAR